MDKINATMPASSSPLHAYFVSLVSGAAANNGNMTTATTTTFTYDATNILLIHDNAKARPSKRRQPKNGRMPQQLKMCRWSSGTLCDMDTSDSLLVGDQRRRRSVPLSSSSSSLSMMGTSSSRKSDRWGSCSNLAGLDETRGETFAASRSPQVPTRRFGDASIMTTQPTAAAVRRHSCDVSSMSSSLRKSVSLPSMFVELPYDVSESTTSIVDDEDEDDGDQDDFGFGLCIDDDDDDENDDFLEQSSTSSPVVLQTKSCSLSRDTIRDKGRRRGFTPFVL